MQTQHFRKNSKNSSRKKRNKAVYFLLVSPEGACISAIMASTKFLMKGSLIEYILLVFFTSEETMPLRFNMAKCWDTTG